MDKDQYYIVGVSGGVDSMVLLDMLLKQDYKLIVCHVNYHYRNDSMIDTDIVTGYCKVHNLLCEVLHVDPKEEVGNFQDYARVVRFDFYSKQYIQYNAVGVFLGHHKDDDIESKVMAYEQKRHKGYMGIEEVSVVKDMKIYRPLLKMHKSELYDYATKYSIPFHEDYTNFMTEFYRDKVRNVRLKDIEEEELLMILQFCEKQNEKLSDVLKIIEADIQFYEMNNYLNYSSITIDLLEYILYELLKKYIYPPKISNALIQEIIKQCKSKVQIEMILPDGYMFYKEYDTVFIVDQNNIVSYSYKIDELKSYKNEFFSLSLVGNENEGVYVEDKDFPLTIRSVLPGDFIVTKGGTKKVSRLFINHKIPNRLRKQWPILVNAQGDIILVPNIAKNIHYLYTTPNLYVLK